MFTFTILSKPLEGRIFESTQDLRKVYQESSESQALQSLDALEKHDPKDIQL